jgi:hypothetical protein
MAARAKRASARVALRAYQAARGGECDSALIADLEFLQSKDLDLSVRLGALLAFDALMVTAAINPIAASPGAPLSLDAPTQPLEVIAVSICVILLAVSSYICVKGILVGEEFGLEGIEGKPEAIRQRLLAAWCISVDAQATAIAHGSRFTIWGGIATVLVCGWIMARKMLGI